MIANLPAQVYGKNSNNLYDTLIHADALLLRPVDRAVTFEWSPGAGIYPPVWALWVEPGQQWALLYCFEDKGAETKGDMRPHTLRRTAGLCTKAELPLITALAAGKQPVSRNVHESGRWEIEFEAPSQPDFSLWRTHVIHDGGNSRYRIKMNDLNISPNAPCQSVTTKSKATSRRANRLIGILGALALLAVGIAYLNLEQRYAKVCEENRELREKVSQESEQQRHDDHKRERAQEIARDILMRAQEIARELEE